MANDIKKKKKSGEQTDKKQTFKKNVKKAVKQTGKAVKKTAQFVEKYEKPIKVGIDLAKAIAGNHPDWYTKGMSSNSGLNFNIELGQTTSTNKQTVVALNHTVVLSPVGVLTSANGQNGSYDLEAFQTSVDIAFRRLRASNSGNVNYYSGDLAKYILDFRIYRAFLIDAISKIKIFNNVHVNNRRTPLNSQKALGLSDEDIKYILENRANLIDGINYEIDVYNKSMRMLPGMALFSRDEWLFTNVFLDSGNIKAVPSGFSIADTSFGIDADLDWEEVSHDTNAVNMLQVLRTLRSRITNSANSKSNTIQGDIEKIEPGNPYKLDYLDFSQEVNEVYDEYLNSQLRNAVRHGVTTLIPTAYTDGELIISTTDPGAEKVSTQYEILITSDENDPIIGKQMSMTRFSSPWVTTAERYRLFTMLNTNLIQRTFAYYFVNTTNELQVQQVFPITTETSSSYAMQMLINTQVSNAPLIRVVTVDDENIAVFGNIDVTAEFSRSQARTFGSIAMKSMMDFGATEKSGFKTR